MSKEPSAATASSNARSTFAGCVPGVITIYIAPDHPHPPSLSGVSRGGLLIFNTNPGRHFISHFRVILGNRL
jgi:hypothetical protein